MYLYIYFKQNEIRISLRGNKREFAGSTVHAKHSGFRMFEKNLGCFVHFSYSGSTVNMKDLFVFQCIRIIIASTSHIDHEEFVKACHGGINTNERELWERCFAFTSPAVDRKQINR